MMRTNEGLKHMCVFHLVVMLFFYGSCEESNRQKQLLSDSCAIFQISAGTGSEHTGERI